MKRSGFTIVEIALVLAIAGLIFLMAFIALPSLWASQRDADRRARVMEFISDVKTYQTNNSRGALPTLSVDKIEFTISDPTTLNDNTRAWYNFVQDYVLPGKTFEDPSGEEYRYFIAKCKGTSGDISTGEACSNDKFSSVNQDVANINGGVDHFLYVAIGATCDGDRLVKTNSSRAVAAIQLLERAGRYCYNT